MSSGYTGPSTCHVKWSLLTRLHAHPRHPPHTMPLRAQLRIIIRYLPSLPLLVLDATRSTESVLRVLSPSALWGGGWGELFPILLDCFRELALHLHYIALPRQPKPL